MNNTKYNILFGSIALSFLMLASTSCSDDHFDVKYNEGTRANTLFQNIESSHVTDSLAMILKRTYVMKKNDPTRSSKETYAQLLSSPQFYTVWAPKDGTYNAGAILKKLDERDRLFAEHPSSTDPMRVKAWKINYDVGRQFVQNQIAYYNYESGNNIHKVTLLNSKICYYDPAKQMFNNIPIDTKQNSLMSSNGALHILDGESPYAYNLYNYLEFSPQFSSVWKVLSDSAISMRRFSPQLSVPGAMNASGNMVYVDSVFTTTNSILDHSGAYLSNEDSMYIALIPSNNSWEEAVEKVKGLFNYANSYRSNWDAQKNQFSIVAPSFNVDSLQSLNTKNLILRTTYFSLSRFPIANLSDSAAVINHALHADSLISTTNNIFYNQDSGNVNPIFNGEQPLKASNGYIFALDKYNINPAYCWIQKNVYSLISSFFIAGTSGATSDQGDLITLSQENRNTDVVGNLENNKYRRFEVDRNNTMIINFKMPGLLSARYKISAVLIPNRINLAYDKDNKERTQFKCQVLDDALHPISETKTIKIDPDSIKTYVLFDSVTIPKCYANLPGNVSSFPLLQLKMARIDQIRGKSKAISISKIIIEPVRE